MSEIANGVAFWVKLIFSLRENAWPMLAILRKRDILPMLDYHLNLPVWNFAFTGFNSEMDFLISIDSRHNTNHFWV